MTDIKPPPMHVYSDTAWDIASLYSHCLASETRDLAAQIDKALADQSATLKAREAKLVEALEAIANDPYQYGQRIQRFKLIAWEAISEIKESQS